MDSEEEAIMPNGRPGDHPLTDLFVHHQTVYGTEADALMLKIDKLCRGNEFMEWWGKDIAHTHDPVEILSRAKLKYAELLARKRGS